MHIGLPGNNPGYWGIAALTHESTAVTGAAMMTRRDVFDLRVGGFDEQLPHEYNDVAYCMQLQRRGLLCVTVCSTEMMHFAGATRTQNVDPAYGETLIRDRRLFASLYPERDRYWNHNLGLAASAGTYVLQGLNLDQLAWETTLPADDAERVLLINDPGGFDGAIYPLVQAGAVPFQADLSGFTLKLVTPGTPNAPKGWDIRNSKAVGVMLERLGITKIVLRSLVGQEGAAPPIETLRTLCALAAKFDMALDPADPMTLCPWTVRDGRENNSDLFGFVDMAAWQEAYAQLQVYAHSRRPR
jgi:hypothetical protein